MVRPTWFEEHPPACTCSVCQEKRAIRQQNGKVGRNDKCPCGSGKKFKKCHGQ